MTQQQIQTITFEGDLSIATAAQSKERLQKAAEGADGVRISFGEISRIDLTLLQLLHATRQQCSLFAERPLPRPLTLILEEAHIQNPDVIFNEEESV